MEFEEFKKDGYYMLPLGLMRVIIKQGENQYDSRDALRTEDFRQIYAYVHHVYKSYVDGIANADGYVLVEVDSNNNPISFEVKDVPQELKDRIK